MTALTQEIMERVQKLGDTEQEQVLQFIHALEMSEAEGTWTPEELAKLMESLIHPKPKTGAEIIVYINSLDSTGWEHIEDGAEWVAVRRGYRD